MTSSPCREFLNELCDYLDGKCSAKAEHHLARCRRCRIVCETTRQTVALYRRWSTDCAVPEDVERRLMAALGCTPRETL